MLTDEQKQYLIATARASVNAAVQRRAGHVPAGRDDLPDASGVFVTLKRRGELRGCLGTLDCRADLAREVLRCAADSATGDPRFSPVSPEELDEIAIEVSILGPLEEVDAPMPESIVVGRHGIVVEQGARRGLLLPQVAPEWGWSASEFLEHTCHKAGLPRDAWRRGARVYRFEAEVFGSGDS